MQPLNAARNHVQTMLKGTIAHTPHTYTPHLSEEVVNYKKKAINQSVESGTEPRSENVGPKKLAIAYR